MRPYERGNEHLVAELSQRRRLKLALDHGAAADEAAADGERGLLASDLFPRLRPLANP